MVLNDSFSALFSSPLRHTNDSFNDSFNDKMSIAPSVIFRILQKEHDHISSILRFHPPTPSQYQNSLIELVSLFERCEDQTTIGLQKLIVAVFLKLAANILNATGKPKYQAQLYRLSQLIADTIPFDLGDESPEIEHKTMKKWVDRIIIECTIHLIDSPNFQLDIDYFFQNIDNVVEEMGLTNGKFQFVRSTVFEVSREMAVDLKLDTKFSPESRFRVEHLGDEHILQLILWFFLRCKPMLNGDFLSSLFPAIPLTPDAQEITKYSATLLDIKLYLVSLSVIASTTTESGTTSKSEPVVAAQLALTKHQKDCWRAVVDAAAGKPPTALSRLRTAQLIDAVRLTSDGSEDVRVLFEAWKRCLQPSAAHDEHVFEAIRVLTEKYRTKMNSILAYGPFYSSDPSSFLPTSSGSTASRRDMRTLFPLQFDYEFVGTTEAGHIGVVINSVEGYLNLSVGDGDVAAIEVVEDDDDDVGTDDTFQTAFSGSPSSADNSQFFSPLKPRPSIDPGFDFDGNNAASFTITQRVMLTPSSSSAAAKKDPFRATVFRFPLANSGGTDCVTPERTPPKSSGNHFGSPRKPINIFQNEDEDASFEEEEEVDELEMALLESTKKHETQQQRSLEKSEKSVVAKTPTKHPQDAQTETDDMSRYESSGSESIVSVRYTPKREVEEPEKVLESDELEDSEEEEQQQDDDDEEVEEEDGEDHDESGLILTEQEDEELFEHLLHGLYANFAELSVKKMGMERQTFTAGNCTEEEVMGKVEQKLSQISNQINESIRKLEGLAQPSVTTITTITTQCPRENLKLVEEIEKIEKHDAKKCLGCQSDEIQEKALRRLEQMALEWDAEGNDYLYE